MGNRIIISAVVVASVLCLSFALAQDAQAGAQTPEGWNACPRCQNNADRTAAWERNNIDGITDYDRRDLSGVWGYDGVGQAFRTPPPLTSRGQELYNVTLAEQKTQDGAWLYGRGSEKDYGLLDCDPLGWPRMYIYNYGFEFVMLPDRVLQFLELEHTWRTIWTDGRELPEDPPVLNWLGWNVGHWEGDTLVIESNGYDDRSWIDRTGANGDTPGGGLPHSDQMRVIERYTRTTYGTLEADLTLIDPVVYAEPWVTETATIRLVPDTELWENMCVASEVELFNDEVNSR
jgi:hypothetical protein